MTGERAIVTKVKAYYAEHPDAKPSEASKATGASLNCAKKYHPKRGTKPAPPAAGGHDFNEEFPDKGQKGGAGDSHDDGHDDGDDDQDDDHDDGPKIVNWRIRA